MTILVQFYFFTSAPIAKALLDAHKRGVHVEAILDKSQRTEQYSSATFLANAGIPTYVEKGVRSFFLTFHANRPWKGVWNRIYWERIYAGCSTIVNSCDTSLWLMGLPSFRK